MTFTAGTKRHFGNSYTGTVFRRRLQNSRYVIVVVVGLNVILRVSCTKVLSQKIPSIFSGNEFLCFVSFTS